MPLHTLRFPKAASVLAVAVLLGSATGEATPIAGGAPIPAPSSSAIPLSKMPVRISGTVPTECDTQGDRRETLALRGEFPPPDAHGAALIVTETGKPPIAVPYDPTGVTIPSFSYGPRDTEHLLTVVFDGRVWCSGTGYVQFQLLLGGRLSNAYNMHISDDDE
jgi:hypothetical protein